MIDNYEVKKENGLIAIKKLDNDVVEITESQFNPLTAKKEIVTTHQTSEQQLSFMLTDNNNQIEALKKRGASMKALYEDLGFGEKKEPTK